MDRPRCALCLLALMAPLIALPVALAQDWQREPYLGLRVRDAEGGVVVSWVLPGPLGGTGFESRVGLRRGDVIEAAGGAIGAGEAITSAAQFNELVESLSVGDLVTLRARRPAGADPGAAVPRAGEGGEIAMYTAEIASRDTWSGTLGRGLGKRAAPEPAEGEFEVMIRDTARDLGVLEEPAALGDLLPYLAEVQQKNLDPNSLPVVLAGFARPLSLDAQAGRLARLAEAAARDPHRGLLDLLHETLDIPRVDHADADATEQMHAASAPPASAGSPTPAAAPPSRPSCARCATACTSWRGRQRS
jgi:hypothetical protein